MKLLPVATSAAHRLSILTVISVTAIASGSMFAPSSQALTATTRFVCARADGKPATVARTKKGDVPIVIWSSEGFSEAGFTPQVRCQQVSARFQSLYRSGQLKYITAGSLNKLPVVCATTKLGNTCNQQNLLYTLKPNSDPQLVIARLMAIRNRASSRGLEESAAMPTTDIVNSVDLDWLDEED
ncbi:COP23 domain-containing protein [Chamaesiphon sp.]|uniref:COP23 domain-containing protein n=1 Tax=Chamaesiphon sp. TaxID=2814140 RepID=UPI0035940040